MATSSGCFTYVLSINLLNFFCILSDSTLCDEIKDVADTACVEHKCADLHAQSGINTFIFENAAPTQQCCGLCLCTDEFCHIYGKNCTQINDQISTRLSPFMTSHQTCIQLNLKSHMSLPTTSTFLYMSDRCPTSYHFDAISDLEKMSVIERCENASGYASFNTRLPILDQRTGLSFINVYCARCNGVPDNAVIFYTTRLVCRDDLYWPTHINKVISDVLLDKSCNLLYEAPNSTNLSPFRCSEKRFEYCNVDVEATCFSDILNHVIGTLCHVTHNREMDLLRCATTDVQFIPVPFSRILRLENVEMFEELEQEEIQIAPKPNNECGKDEFYDKYKDICRQLSCVAPRTLINSSCELFVTTISGIDFDVFLKLKPINDRISIDQGAPGIATTFSLVQSIFSIEMLASSATHIYIMGDTGTDLTPSTLIHYALFHIQMSIDSVTEVDAVFMDKFLNLHDTHVHSGIDGIPYGLELVHFENINGTMMDAISQEELFLFDSHEGFEFSPIRHEPIVTILPTSGCPLVSLSTGEYDIVHEPGHLSIKELNFTSIKWNYRAEYDYAGLSSIDICVDVYESAIEGMINDPTQGTYVTSISPKSVYSGTSMATSVLSIICLSISVICSSLTLLTYILFKEMRTQPGINNMALCIALILAQTCFIFGVGQKDSVPDWLCISIGVFVHFFSLLAIMWMNVCSLHSFKIFWTLDNGRNNSGSVQITTMYTVYTTTMSVCPVILNILLSTISDRDSTGYGEHLCYISSSTMIIVTFGLPVAAVVATNFVLFIATVIRIRKTTSRVAKTLKERNYFVVYCRLSTVCGCFWLFGILYMFTGNVVLDFLFILFNATQGLCIFISFICNKACAKRYMNLVYNMKPSPGQDTRTSSTRVRPLSV